jgi:low temperature requirement protein LtrA
MEARHRRDLLRPRHANQKARVTNSELFFDSVLVFAVTQLSHSLLNALGLTGAIHVSLLFLAVWWVSTHIHSLCCAA